MTRTPSAYRGFMLDPARHFQSVKTVKRVIRLMAAYRLNVLHLHLTDGQGWRIDYTETQQDYESHDVVLTMDRGIVTMQRSGPFGTSMVFEQGRRFEGVYSTPYGELEMGVYPTRVRYRIEGQRGMGEVNLAYQLDLQGHFAAMHELQIRFCPSGGA